MAKPTQRADTAIDKLLQDRAQFISWITRLTGPSSSNPAVPEAVRHRVRADYEGRLQSVVEALRSHQTDLEQQMSEFAGRRNSLSARESEAKERLSEAEVRHMVGEYDDGRWQTIRADLTREVVGVQEELSRTNAEIERLDEVLTTIRAPLPSMEPEPEPEPEPAPPPVAEAPPPAPAPPPPIPGIMTEFTAPQSDQRPVAAAHGNEIPFKPAPKPQPKPPAAKPKEDSAGRTLWFPSGKPGEAPAGKMDELAFLKSVTGNEGAAAPAQPGKRPSGGFTKPIETAAPAAPAAPPAPAPAPVAEAKDRPSGTAPKTLKCGECGTMNRPTEWYCERCGAELAAL
ncbi:MAG TPA: hypothetical protein VFU03_05705 [Gemmatimonadales bacterium]|nr:hypothetical protein [Gemmatimonadales bacterium]